jgi:hypothetical protein
LGAGAAACGKGEQDQHVVQCMSDYSTMLGNLGAGNGHRRRLQRVGDAQSAQAQTLMVAGLATASSGPLVRRQTRAALLNCTAFAVTLAVMAEKHGAQYSIKNKMLFLCTTPLSIVLSRV